MKMSKSDIKILNKAFKTIEKLDAVLDVIYDYILKGWLEIHDLRDKHITVNYIINKNKITSTLVFHDSVYSRNDKNHHSKLKLTKEDLLDPDAYLERERKRVQKFIKDDLMCLKRENLNRRLREIKQLGDLMIKYPDVTTSKGRN